MTKQFRSRVIASIHETAEGLRAAGVMDKPGASLKLLSLVAKNGLATVA
jgi:hypothetical protein